MAKENYIVVQQRLKIVQACLSEASSISDVCNTFGISRKTAYKWIERFLEFGEAGLETLSNSPHNPLGSVGAGRLTALSVNLIKAGVVPEWIRPGHPEENGRHERFHLTLQQEIALTPEKTLATQIRAMNEFKDRYNFERPHEALNMKTPGSYYRKSPRSWNGLLKSPEYDLREFEVRKVCPNGCIRFSGQEHYIGKTVSGEYVGLRYSEREDVVLHYGPIYLRIINNKGFEKLKLPRRRS